VKTQTALKLTALAAVITLSTLNANAALYDRGNGMIYDSTQNITWLQDANYAKTSGYDADGYMTWQQSTDWAANLTYGGFTDWRLSSAGLNGTSCSTFPNDGSTDCSYNNTRSEIGHLFLELGNKAYYSTTGVYQPGYGVTDTTFVDGTTNQNVSFLNLQNYAYWEAETYAPNPAAAWGFETSYGGQLTNGKIHNFYAWAVHAGDVAAVPVPAAGWLFMTALVGLVGKKRLTRR
jgi:hypothetical protein